MTYRNGELGYWFDSHCESCGCEHRDWIPAIFGPITLREHRTKILIREIYAPILEEQLKGFYRYE